MAQKEDKEDNDKEEEKAWVWNGYCYPPANRLQNHVTKYKTFKNMDM
jgi:hypothetical protein